MISKLLETMESLSSCKIYNNQNTTTKSNSSNNDFEIPSSSNTHLGLPQWDILSTNFDRATSSCNEKSINVIPSILIEDQPHEMRIQKDAQFKEYLRLHSEEKKLEEKLDTYPLNIC